MPPKQLKKFCRLTKYIEQTNRDFYQVIDDLCLQHHFKANRNSNGVTLLMCDKKLMQTIVNAAYSTEPEKAQHMVKSIILQSYFPDADSFSNNEPINLLNQRLSVESVKGDKVHLSNGFVLEKDSNFVPLGYNENTAVWHLKGAGKLPLSGSPAEARPAKMEKSGGGLFGNSRSKLHKLLESRYNRDNTINVYMQKVYLQLGVLQRSGKLNPELLNYLGNDEITDSYLLDMYCSKHHDQCFKIVYTCLGAASGKCPEQVATITLKMYQDRKAEIVKSLGGQGNASDRRPADLFSNVRSALDVRDKVISFYGHNKEIMGKDLFIVFSNVCKELWQSDPSMYNNYAYLASSVYKHPKDIIAHDHDVARDLSLYGNLLKSDVLFFSPEGKFETYPAGYDSSLKYIPSPVEMKKYSLNAIQESYRTIVKTGGDGELAAALQQAGFNLPSMPDIQMPDIQMPTMPDF